LTFFARINNRIKTAETAEAPIRSEPRFRSVSSSLPQADLGTGIGISSTFPPFLWSDTLPSASP
jgi:hypothetical protein